MANGKSWDEYYREAREKGAAALQEQLAARQKSDDESIGRYNRTADQSAEAAVQQYRLSIDEAPDAYQEQYDANALQEAVTLRQIEEAMANLGLSGSGLERAQQTGSRLTRTKADAAVRREQQDYVDSLKQAIDRVLAETDEKKQKNERSIRQATGEWIANRTAKAETEAQKSASDAYAAEQKRLADIEKALIAQQTAKSKASATGNTGAKTAKANGSNTTDAAYRQAYNRALNAGYDKTYAAVVADARTNMPESCRTEQEQEAYVNKAINAAAADELKNAFISLNELLPDSNTLRGYRGIQDAAVRRGDSAEIEKAIRLTEQTAAKNLAALSARGRSYAMATAAGTLLGSLDRDKSDRSATHTAILSVLRRHYPDDADYAAAVDALNATPYASSWVADLLG